MVTDDCELFRSDSDPLVQFLVGQIESRKPDTRSVSYTSISERLRWR